jgi:hypothetical protein|tara:strand:+ start:60 stop:251 length:192 start_codon:yes stop_codon:yes gene_type:complete
MYTLEFTILFLVIGFAFAYFLNLPAQPTSKEEIKRMRQEEKDQNEYEKLMANKKKKKRIKRRK